VAVTFDVLAGFVRSTFIKKISSARRTRLSTFLRSKDRNSGVYFIFDDEGELVYIGKSKAIRARISGHLCPGQRSGLLWYVCRQVGVSSEKAYGHMCNCGRFTECHAGKHTIPPEAEADDVAEEIRNTYTILVMRGRADGELERLMTSILRPKYTFDDETWES
jgi:hypothetical protein